MFNSSAMLVGSLAFRPALHYSASLAYGKHYIALVTLSSVALRKPSQRNVAAKASNATQSYLAALGERVREARARRGISRKLLAADSGVSERYLAQLEAGQGNVSILLLRQIAIALDLPLAELLAEDSAEAAELTLTTQFLRQLPRQKLATVRAQLVRDYGSARDERMKRIALVGLRGAGKSTLGARLAKLLGRPFVELNREIEREAGTSLSEIFLLYGQAGYRRYERRSLEKVLEKNERAVIATGGSIVSEPGTYELLLSSCFTVWLKAAPEEHMARVIAQGDTRPMAGNDQAMQDLRRILDGRAMLYRQADVVVDTAGKSVERSLAELRKSIGA
jgi:XRE family transcriptional regulator, aerobic/anaerobic benzoate catabolism transcriptional regulator